MTHLHPCVLCDHAQLVVLPAAHEGTPALQQPEAALKQTTPGSNGHILLQGWKKGSERFEGEEGTGT